MKRQVRRRRNQTESLEVRALLSTITVTSLADNTESDSEVTLREALLAANEDRSVDGSEAGSGADTIVFAAGLEGGTIELSDGQLPIKSDITIAGPTDRITIDAQEDSRVFIIDSAEEVSLLDLRLVNGRAGSGGAIRSLATTLSLTRTDFESNYAAKDAGAVHVIGSASGALNVTDSLFKYNGSARGYGAISS